MSCLQLNILYCALKTLLRVDLLLNMTPWPGKVVKKTVSRLGLEHNKEIVHLCTSLLSTYKVLHAGHTSVNKADMGFVHMGLTV